MISPQFFIDKLCAYDLDFFSGVPDSLLKNICAYLSDNVDSRHNIIAANEGAAIGIAAGYHLSTGKIGVVYMQNSGVGNIINPLASLTDKEVYNIPVLLLIGWRGRPGTHDEPQHVKQGKVTIGLLNTMGINYAILSKDKDQVSKQITTAVEYMKKTNECFALIIEKDTFEDYKLKNVDNNSLSMTREEAIKKVASSMDDNDIIVSTTGMISRELFEARENWGQNHERDFLTVGSMGHASQIALGLAISQCNRKIWCFDGDGASIMHMGSMGITASLGPKNYIHVIYNNGAHDSVGGQPTVGFKINYPALAKALGYKEVYSVDNMTELSYYLANINNLTGPILLEIKVRKGNRQNLGRPTTTPIQNKKALMNFLRENK